MKKLTGMSEIVVIVCCLLIYVLTKPVTIIAGMCGYVLFYDVVDHTNKTNRLDDSGNYLWCPFQTGKMDAASFDIKIEKPGERKA